jgi:hypothetical protein
MKVRVEFLPDNNGSTETAIIEADTIDQRNGWIIISDYGRIVFATNEKCVKYCWLYEEDEFD